MSRISVVSMGPGNIRFMLQEAIFRLQGSELVIGSFRQVEDVKSLLDSKTKLCIYKKIQEILELVQEYPEEKISILVSGDSGYYSLVPYLKQKLEEEFDIIPGISSFQYLFSKLGENWQEYQLASVHGRDFDYSDALRNEAIKGLVLLTDDVQNPYEIAKKLVDDKIKNIECIVGENLSYDEERITRVDLEEYERLNRTFAMNVLVLKKKSK